MIRRLGALALLASLAACAPVAVRTGTDADFLAAQSAREAALASDLEWRMSGRLAVSANGEGGSGRIEWRQSGDDFEIRLSAPVTGKSWTLLQANGRVVLEGLEGGVREGVDAQALLAEVTGWQIPVTALSAWARGARAGADAEMEFGPQGLPALISEQGWAVEYREWDDAEPSRPRRLFARRDARTSVRLVVESWEQP